MGDDIISSTSSLLSRLAEGIIVVAANGVAAVAAGLATNPWSICAKRWKLWLIAMHVPIGDPQNALHSAQDELN